MGKIRISPLREEMSETTDQMRKLTKEMLAKVQTRSLEMRSGRTLYLKALGTFHALPKRK